MRRCRTTAGVTPKRAEATCLTALRRLGSYSRRNRLYQAFRELGRVVRTIFLLEFLNDAKLREQITATTNKVEAYNGFAKWLNFGGEGVIDTIDPVEQEKHLKYNHLVANAAAIQNVIDPPAPCGICRATAISYAVTTWPSSVPTRRDA